MLKPFEVRAELVRFNTISHCNISKRAKKPNTIGQSETRPFNEYGECSKAMSIFGTLNRFLQF